MGSDSILCSCGNDKLIVLIVICHCPCRSVWTLWAYCSRKAVAAGAPCVNGPQFEIMYENYVGITKLEFTSWDNMTVSGIFLQFQDQQLCQ